MKTYWDIYQGAYTAYRNLDIVELVKIHNALIRKEQEIIATMDSVKRLIQKKSEQNAHENRATRQSGSSSEKENDAKTR